MGAFICIYVFPFSLVQLITENLWIMKLATKKKIGPTKYPWEKILDPRNANKKKF